jgi:hypothetical protein
MGIFCHKHLEHLFGDRETLYEHNAFGSVTLLCSNVVVNSSATD